MPVRFTPTYCPFWYRQTFLIMDSDVEYLCSFSCDYKSNTTSMSSDLILASSVIFPNTYSRPNCLPQQSRYSGNVLKVTTDTSNNNILFCVELLFCKAMSFVKITTIYSQTHEVSLIELCVRQFVSEITFQDNFQCCVSFIEKSVTFSSLITTQLARNWQQDEKAQNKAQHYMQANTNKVNKT